jgi:hypothetical protein
VTIYSTKEQLEKIAGYLTAYMKIPYFQDDTIPGKVMEKIISLVHSGEQLATYDYVDVCKRGDVGWQVKSTKDKTPLTWKRAKIANSANMIRASETSDEARQKLGNAIIDFCNQHAHESLALYNLDEIGYARLIMFDDGTAIYFERLISTKASPDIFNKDDFTWEWSTPKEALKKEQLPALHGTNVHTKKKAFAWHGRGENQLHFSGEKDWWPVIEWPNEVGVLNFSEDNHAMAFKLSSDKLAWDDLVGFLNGGN